MLLPDILRVHHSLLCRVIRIGMNLLLNSKNCLVGKLFILEHFTSESVSISILGSRRYSQKANSSSVLP